MLKKENFIFFMVISVFILCVSSAAYATDESQGVQLEKNAVTPQTSTTTVNSVLTSSGLTNRSQNPAISGDIVVYEKAQYYNIVGPDSKVKSEIYWKNLSDSNKGGRVSSYFGSFQESPAISGNTIVWSDNRTGKWVIYSKNIATANGGRVSSYTGEYLEQRNPAISGGFIVWEDHREIYPVIYYLDPLLDIDRRVSSYSGSNLWQQHPAISGSKVVWEDQEKVSLYYTGKI